MPKNEQPKMNTKSRIIKIVLLSCVLLLLFAYSKNDTGKQEFAFKSAAYLYEGNQLVGINTNQQADELILAQNLRADEVTSEAQLSTEEVVLSTKVVKSPSLVNFDLTEKEQQKNINYATKQTKVLEEGYTITIDNLRKFYITDLDAMEWVKDKILLAYLPNQSYVDYYNGIGEFKPYTEKDKKFTKINIANKITVQSGYVTGSKYVENQEDLLFELFHKNQEASFDLITDTASIKSIIAKNKLSDTEFKLNNPTLTENTVTFNGLKVVVNEIDPILDVVQTFETVKTKKVKYDTVQKVDDKLLKGQYEITTKGKTGTKEITYENKMVNGEVVSSEKVKEEVTVPPVHRVISVGEGTVLNSISVDGESSAGPSSDDKPNASGFIWPTSSKTITCGYGCYAGHVGMDTQSYRGGPIYAAKSGIVVTSGWSNFGYGYHVVIDHGNGVKTLYAHQMQQPPVSVGQFVEGGQVIGFEGNTGNVQGRTGIHLHFELQINGTAVNPYPYVS